jgi:predicted transcriptional regulator
MELGEIQKLVQAEMLTGEDALSNEVTSAMASDLMSDVLSFCCPRALLITGLTNSQSVRTAELAELSAVLFTRGKKPSLETIQMARDRSVPLLTTKLPLYEVCGILYSKGMGGI